MADPAYSKNQAVAPTTAESPSQETPKKGYSFWLVILSLCLIGFLASLDGSIIAIALPHISGSLDIGERYVEIANSFVFAQTVVQPAIAQLCDIFGRRWPLILSTAVFAAGSAIAGSSNNTATMIVGRTIQGLGSGGIMLLVELVVCDMVPLKERGKYLGIVLSTAALGAIVGPVVGGVIAERDWRWCFYMNLPICAIIIPIQILFVRIKHLQIPWRNVLVKVDWIGNTIFIGAITALLIGLAFGGTKYSWSSWRTILPITLGSLGWIGFHCFEHLIRAKHPCIPPHVFQNRTSMAAFYMIFVVSMLLQWVCFFWPVYFLAVRGTTLTQTGVNFMPFMFFLIPGSAVAGVILSKTGQYRYLHAIGFILSTIGPGLNTLLGRNTHAGLWALFQILDALGRACILPTTLPAVLASLSERDVAAATGVYSFLRSFGYVWGLTIPGIIFKNRFDAFSHIISDAIVREQLSGGRAYEFSSGPYVQNLGESVKSEVLEVYLRALKDIWWGAMAFGASGLIAVAIEKHVPLRTVLETEFGLHVDQAENEKDKEKSGVVK